MTDEIQPRARLVYIAGAYEGGNIIDTQANMRRGHALALAALNAGYAVYDPWLDFTWGLLAPVARRDYQENSMTFLSRCDALLVAPQSENSEGTKAEVAYALTHGVPVFHDFDALVKAMPPWGGEVSDGA